MLLRWTRIDGPVFAISMKEKYDKWEQYVQENERCEKEMREQADEAKRQATYQSMMRKRPPANDVVAEEGESIVAATLRRAREVKEEGSELYREGSIYNVKKALATWDQALLLCERTKNFVKYKKDPDLGEEVGASITAEAVTLQSTLRLNCAAAFLRLKDYHQCVASCDEVLATDTANVKGWYRKAQALAALGNRGDATEALDALLALEPDNAAALQLARQVAQSGDKRVADKKVFSVKSRAKAQPTGDEGASAPGPGSAGGQDPVPEPSSWWSCCRRKQA